MHMRIYYVELARFRELKGRFSDVERVERVDGGGTSGTKNVNMITGCECVFRMRRNGFPRCTRAYRARKVGQGRK